MNKIYICTHVDFDCPVNNKAYEVIDIRCLETANGLRTSFYSELLTHKYIADQKHKKNDIVGFCGYRRYFDFLDKVPKLSKIIKDHGCITTEPLYFPGGNLRTQYASFTNVEDLDLVTSIIDKHYPEFFAPWMRAVQGHTLHAGNLYIMAADQQKEMMNLVWGILDKYLEIVGTDIDRRIETPKYMHLPESARHDYQYRIGGHLGERIVSAWIDWQFPQALNIGIAPIETAK